jgi:glycosyltransferase involved in cell wall biosynthesis
MKKSILVICPFPQNFAAGQRLKYEQYFDHWKENGYEITVSSFMDRSMWDVVYLKGNYIKKVLGTIRGYSYRVLDLFRISQYDIVYVFMWVSPFGSTFFERVFRALSKKLIYDIEDNTMVVASGSVNRIVSMLKNPNKNKFLMKEADYVITSSPALNDYCLKINNKGKCKFISSSVNTDIFFPKNSFSNEKKVVIGWTGTFSSKKYLDILRPVFIELKKECDFRLIVIGNFEYELHGIDLEVIQWNLESEVADMQKIDIGIYPLSDDPWVYGKSGLKAIQYMSFGLPTVATNIGTTASIIKHMDNGWLVKDQNDWVLALKKLISNPKLRKSFGDKARITVVQRYSIDVIKAEYLSIIENICKE